MTDRESGNLTARGETILNHTPMGRFGSPEDLVGAALWLLSPASSFVSGVVVLQLMGDSRRLVEYKEEEMLIGKGYDEGCLSNQEVRNLGYPGSRCGSSGG